MYCDLEDQGHPASRRLCHHSVFAFVRRSAAVPTDEIYLIAPAALLVSFSGSSITCNAFGTPRSNSPPFSRMDASSARKARDHHRLAPHAFPLDESRRALHPHDRKAGMRRPGLLACSLRSALLLGALPDAPGNPRFVLQIALVLVAVGVAFYCTTSVGRPAEIWAAQGRPTKDYFARLKFLKPATLLLFLFLILSVISVGTVVGVPHDKDRAPQFDAASIRRWIPSAMWTLGYDPYAELPRRPFRGGRQLERRDTSFRR